MSENEIRLAVLTEIQEPKRISLRDGKEFVVRVGSIAIGHRTCGIVVDGMIHTISNMHITRIAPATSAAN